MDSCATHTIRLGLIVIFASLSVVAYILVEASMRGLVVLLALIVGEISYVIYQVAHMGAGCVVSRGFIRDRPCQRSSRQ